VNPVDTKLIEDQDEIVAEVGDEDGLIVGC
jgi:hypothetical protein